MARILVVEDDPDQLEMRKVILEHGGHVVVTAKNAAEALVQLAGCQLVVMDLRLPTPADGQRLIQAASGSAKIIVLSGDAETSLPVDEFLTKPCSSRKLLETIARFCLLLFSLCVGLTTVFEPASAFKTRAIVPRPDRLGPTIIRIFCCFVSGVSR